MRVAHFLPNLVVGGRERVAIDLARAGSAVDQRTILLGFECAPSGLATLTPTVPYVQLNRKEPDFARSLQNVLQSANIDIVHAHGHIPAYHIATALSGWGERPALIATMHLGMQGTWRWLWPIRRGLRSIERLCAVSQDMARTYARISGRRVIAIPNGIDSAPFTANMAAWPGSDVPFRFAMMSRLDPVKRHSDAIRAADRLIAMGYRIELHVAGEGAMDARLRAAARTRPWLRLAGPVKPEQFLADKHAFLLPSRAEGAPLALLEAMASGLPCIVSDLPSLRELARDDVHFVPREDPQALANAMAQLAANSAHWREMAARALARAKSFDLASVAESYAGIYADAIATRLRVRACAA